MAAFDASLSLDQPKASDQACDHMCAIVCDLARTAGVEPTPPEWRSGTLPLSHVRCCSIGCRYCEQPSWSWWVGMELNHHSSRGAFTTPWARQCPAYPCAADHRCLKWRKVKESNPRPEVGPAFGTGCAPLRTTFRK